MLLVRDETCNTEREGAREGGSERAREGNHAERNSLLFRERKRGLTPFLEALSLLIYVKESDG